MSLLTLSDRNCVFVVDDDKSILKNLRRLLTQMGYDTLLFSSAEAFRNHRDFDRAVCVLLDINLGNASGIDLRHGLHAANISVPVVYMTGNDKPSVREAAIHSGCLAYLTKPFTAAALTEAVKKAAVHT
jgi:FixJ family two-component response regulator